MAILTIGTFDGVHKGHQEIFRTVQERAKKTGCRSIALVFTYPPKHILNPSREPQQLTLWHEKKKIIKSLGIDQVVPLVFTPLLARTAPERFFKNIVSKFRVKEIVVGFNFAFGQNRQAHVARLKKLGKLFNVKVLVVHPRQHHGMPISSSAIRSYIRQGFLKEVTALLGHHYRISGKVIHGWGWGMRHYVPTANFHVSPRKLLPQGVFVVLLEVGKKTYPAVASIGFRPSIHPVDYLLPEVHVLHKKLSLHKKQVRMHLFKKIRNERYYRTSSLLLTRINKDIAIAEKYFKSHKKSAVVSYT